MDTERILKTISFDLDDRLNFVKKVILPEAENFKALQKVLEVDPFVCYQVLKLSPDTLSGIEDLYTLLNSTLIDDATLGLVCDNDYGWSKSYHMTYISDDKRAVTQEELIQALQYYQDEQTYYRQNRDVIESRLSSIEAKNRSALYRRANNYMASLWELQEDADTNQIKNEQVLKLKTILQETKTELVDLDVMEGSDNFDYDECLQILKVNK